MQAAAVRVPGSTSNLGPGFDVLGLALDRALVARFHPGGRGLEVVRSGTLGERPLRGEDLAVASFLDAFPGEAAPSGRLVLHSDVPVARGMGSSAAARVAGRFLGELAQGRTPDREAILQRVVAHEGHPDNAVPALFGGLVAAILRERRVLWTHLPLSPDVGFVFGDPGVEMATEDARRVLPAHVAHATAAANGARLALLLHGLAVADPELIAAGLDDALHVPYRMPLVSGAAEARSAALEAGAWGVTLSGSGSGLLALTSRGREGTVAEALVSALRAAGHPRARAGTVRPDPLGAREEPTDVSAGSGPV